MLARTDEPAPGVAATPARESTAMTMRRKSMQWRPYKPVRACCFVAVLILLSCGIAQTQEFEGAWGCKDHAVH
jgi:hypothetical protein